MAEQMDEPLIGEDDVEKYGSREKHESEDESEQPPCSQQDAAVNLTKGFLGAASFELPWAVDQSGLWSGLLSLVVFAVVSAHTLKLLARCRKVSKQKNPCYGDLGKEAYGEKGEALVTFGVVSMSLGVCAAYLVFVASTLDRLFQDVWHLSALEPVSGSPQLVPMMMIAPVAIVLAQIRNFKSLSWLSIVGIGLVILTLIYALAFGFINEVSTMDKNMSDYPFLKYKTYPLFFGNAAFLFCIHTVGIPIEQSMKLEPDKENTQAPAPYASAVNLSVVFVAILNIIFAAICMPLYNNWSDGQVGGLRGVQGNIMDNLPLQNNLVVATKLLLCVVMVLTFAIFVQPIAELCEQRYERKYAQKPGFLVSAAMRAFLCMFCIALGLAVPDFSLATGLVGGISNTLIGLVLPPLFYLRLSKINGHELQSHEEVLNGAVIFFGVLLMVVSTAVTINQVINVHNGS